MTPENPTTARQLENLDGLLDVLSNRRRAASGYLPWAVVSAPIHLEDEATERHEQPRTDLALVKSMRAVLAQQDHPFPEFSALLRVLRITFAQRGRSVTDLMEMPESLFLEFERGERHPASLDAITVQRAAQLMGPLEIWTEAVAKATGNADVPPTAD